MNRKKIITAGITFILSAFLLLIIVFVFKFQTVSYMPYVNLMINFAQDSNYNLTLSSIEIRLGYPNFYKTELLSDYYTVSIQDKTSKLLFSGKIPHSITKIADGFGGYKYRGSINRYPLERIKLYLPYFPTAEKVSIADEKGNGKFSLNLSDYHLSPPKGTVNACGNNYCDVTENMISCYKDCNDNLKFLWSEIEQNYLP